MTAVRVVQTKAAFGYPVGKVWGPYKHLADALDRVKLLRRHKGEGKIQAGEWAPCVMSRPEVEFELGEDDE
jgi:hypothetical protein